MQNGPLTNQERQAFAAKEETYLKQLSYYQRVVTHLLHEKHAREAAAEADEDGYEPDDHEEQQVRELREDHGEGERGRLDGMNL